MMCNGTIASAMSVIYFRFEFGYLYSCQQRSSIYIARAIDAGDVVVGTLALVTSGARQVVQAE